MGQFEKWLQDNLIVVAGVFVGVALLQVRSIFISMQTAGLPLAAVKCLSKAKNAAVLCDFGSLLPSAGENAPHQARPVIRSFQTNTPLVPLC